MHPVVREGPILAALAVLWAGTASVWNQVPDRMPIHWNAFGEIDGYGSRAEGLLIAPVIATILVGLMAVLPRWTPALGAAEGAWAVLRLSLVVFLGAVHTLIVLAALGSPLNTATWITFAAGLLFATIGAVLPGIGPNRIAGIRTPWTLSSRRSWDETHRVAGVAFVVVGLMTAAVTPFAGAAALAVLLVGLFIATTVALVVSYRVWRDDPDRGVA